MFWLLKDESDLAEKMIAIEVYCERHGHKHKEKGFMIMMIHSLD